MKKLKDALYKACKIANPNTLSFSKGEMENVKKLLKYFK